MPLQLGASIHVFFAGRDRTSWPTLADAVRSIRELDESLGVEIWAARDIDDPGPTPAEEREISAAGRGAPFTSLHARGRCWMWDPPGLRREIDLAGRLGAQTLIVHPETLGLDDPLGSPDVPEIRRLLDHARRRRVFLALENTVDTLRVLDRALDIAEDDSAFGICIDVGHAAQSHDAGRHPVRAYIERYRGRVIHLHLHDTMGVEDDHGVPGRGIVDWADFLRTLEDTGYDGPAVLEVVSGLALSAGASPEELVREAIAFLSSVA